MQQLWEMVAAWHEAHPWTGAVYVVAWLVGGFVVDRVKYRHLDGVIGEPGLQLRAWLVTLSWPLWVPLYLLWLPARAVVRWWRGRREPDGALTVTITANDATCTIKKGSYFTVQHCDAPAPAPKQPETRAEEATHYLQAEFDQALDVVVSCPNCGYKFPNADAVGVKMLCNGEVFQCGVCEPGKSRLDAIRKKPADSAPTVTPYGSKPDESQRPVTKAELDAALKFYKVTVGKLAEDVEALQDLADGHGESIAAGRIESRLARLESGGAGVRALESLTPEQLELLGFIDSIPELRGVLDAERESREWSG